MKWLDGITKSMGMSLSNFRGMVKDRSLVFYSPQGRKQSDMTEWLNSNSYCGNSSDDNDSNLFGCQALHYVEAADSCWGHPWQKAIGLSPRESQTNGGPRVGSGEVTIGLQFPKLVSTPCGKRLAPDMTGYRFWLSQSWYLHTDEWNWIPVRGIQGYLKLASACWRVRPWPWKSWPWCRLVQSGWLVMPVLKLII